MIRGLCCLLTSRSNADGEACWLQRTIGSALNSAFLYSMVPGLYPDRQNYEKRTNLHVKLFHPHGEVEVLLTLDRCPPLSPWSRSMFRTRPSGLKMVANGTEPRQIRCPQMSSHRSLNREV